MNETTTDNAKPKATKPAPAGPAPVDRPIPIRTLYFSSTRDIGMLEQGKSRVSSVRRPDGVNYRIVFLPAVRMYLVRAYKVGDDPSTAKHAHEFLFDTAGITAEIEPA